MRGTIIVNQNISNHIEYKIKRFHDEFIKKGIPLDVVINDGTIASIINGKVNINLNHPDFIIYMDKDIYLNLGYLKKKVTAYLIGLIL